MAARPRVASPAPGPAARAAARRAPAPPTPTPPARRAPRGAIQLGILPAPPPAPREDLLGLSTGKSKSPRGGGREGGIASSKVNYAS